MGRKIKKIASLQGHNFKEYLKQERSVDVKIKLLVLSNIQEGKSCSETMAILKVSRSAVTKWIQKFAKFGLSGLKRKPGQGRRKRIKKQDFPKIKEDILELQKKRNGGRIRGCDIQQYLLEKWNVSYQKTAVYTLLKDLRLVWISARSKHPSSSQEVQESFKKNF